MYTPTIQWVKFYKTGSDEVVTLSINGYTVQNDGQTHQFTDAADAQARSTVEDFIFWDGMPVGAGHLAA